MPKTCGGKISLKQCARTYSCLIVLCHFQHGYLSTEQEDAKKPYAAAHVKSLYEQTWEKVVTRVICRGYNKATNQFRADREAKEEIEFYYTIDQTNPVETPPETGNEEVRPGLSIPHFGCGFKDSSLTIFFFHEYGRRVGMVPRSSLKEGKNSLMVEKRTRTTKTTQNQTNHSPQAESPPSCSLSSVQGETSETKTND